MDKFIRVREFSGDLFRDQKTAQQGSEIVAGILEACSPGLSNIASKMSGNEVAGYKRIQRFLQDNDPR